MAATLQWEVNCKSWGLPQSPCCLRGLWEAFPSLPMVPMEERVDEEVKSHWFRTRLSTVSFVLLLRREHRVAQLCILHLVWSLPWQHLSPCHWSLLKSCLFASKTLKSYYSLFLFKSWLLSGDTVSLYSPGWPGSYCVG